MIATRIPLSEAARKIHEKGEASQPSQEYVTFEDEQSEWREIIRGIPIVYNKCAVRLKERYRRFGRLMLAYCYRVHGSHRRFVLILLIFVREAIISLSSMPLYVWCRMYRPTIIAGLGFSGGAAQLHTVPPYVPAVVLTGECNRSL